MAFLTMLSSSRQFLFSLILLLACSRVAATDLTELSRNLNIDPTQISVSGVSSGAFMAVQLQVIYSQSIMGAGVIAGGPYRCAAGKYLARWLDFTGMYAMLSVCTHSSPALWNRSASPDVDFSAHETQRLAQAGWIDDPTHLAKQKIWMFSGGKDPLVPTQVMDSLKNYYQAFIPADNISYIKDPHASHGMITDNYGRTCNLALPPFINDCDLDAAGALLQQIYGSLQAKTEAKSINLYTFNQQVFFDNKDPSVSLHRNAHIYIPTACKNGERCKLHIALHGCSQTEDLIGDMFYTQAGYNAWAESNKLVVLYPQTKVWLGASFTTNAQRNFQACWDWWGYSGEHYADKRGKQIRALDKMIKVLVH